MWFVTTGDVFQFLAVNFAWLALLGVFPVQIVVWLTLLWFGCLGLAQVMAGETVSLVEANGGHRQRVLLEGWSSDLITVEADARRDVSLDEIASLHFDRKVITFVGGESLILLANGDRLVARPTSVTEDTLTAAWKLATAQSNFKLPLETIAALVLDLPATKLDRQRLFADLQTLPPGDDLVLLANGDRTQGEFERLDGAFVELKGTAGPLKLDRSRVRALRFNPELTQASKVEGRRLVVSFVDGSRLTATRAELHGSEFKLTTPTKQTLTVSLAAVAACHVYGSCVIPLSDREPLEVASVPYLADRWSLVKNANVRRGPLSLRGAEFGTGLGMHSQMSATYALTGNEREFRATIGVDDCANGAGNVRFAIELDGKRTWTSEELTGRSNPLDIPPVAVHGAKRLTLIVEFGQQADVSDYADWCDAVLIVEPK